MKEKEEEKKFCPICGYDQKEEKELRIEFLEDMLKREKCESMLDVIKKEAKESGILKPEHNSPRHLPKKQPVYDDQGITLYTDTDSEYFIEWGRIKDPVDLLMFVHHLTKKNWINRANINWMIDVTCGKFDIGYLGCK